MSKCAYSHLLQPLKIQNMVLKNRMTASSSVMYWLQGPEPYPTQQLITHIANKAKNGAAVVTVRGIAPRLGPPRVSPPGGPMDHMFLFDLYAAQSQNYLSQLADAVHAYNSKICMNLPCRIFEGYDVSAGLSPRPGQTEPIKELTREMLEEIADSFAEQAKILQELGFDMVHMHMAYRHQTTGRMLSPLTNFRTDEFGGSLENRARFPLMCCRRIKEVCGQSFPVKIQISAEEDTSDPMAQYDTLGSSMSISGKAIQGWTLEDTIEFAKLAEGCVDILQLRCGLADPSHPTGFELQETPFLHYAAAVKRALPADAKIFIETIGGFQDPAACEAALAEGKADLIAMARSWISNSDYGTKILENQADDIVPCIRCNKCHIASFGHGWISACSVNPAIGMEHRFDQLSIPAGKRKKVAVIGGGPGGMKAAMILHDRGHDVTIYEAQSTLGGQIKHAEYVDFKWPLDKLRKYFIHQIGKRDIKVHLNTRATPETLGGLDYDVIVAAVGAKPILPPIPGLKERGFWNAEEVFGHENALGKHAVIIGGGEIGMETGIYLCRNGHTATVIEMREDVAMDSAPLHYRNMFKAAWENQEGLSTVVNARCTKITSEAVYYIDKDGREHALPADSVVIAAGTAGLAEEAMSFFNVSPRLEMVGDCLNVGGGLHKVMRSAYSVASRI